MKPGDVIRFTYIKERPNEGITMEITAIRIDELTATDLHAEAKFLKAQGVVMQAYRVVVRRPDGTAYPETANALHIPATARIGIARVVDAIWHDAFGSAAEAIRAAFVQGDTIPCSDLLAEAQHVIDTALPGEFLSLRAAIARAKGEQP